MDGRALRILVMKIATRLAPLLRRPVFSGYSGLETD